MIGIYSLFLLLSLYVQVISDSLLDATYVTAYV